MAGRVAGPGGEVAVLAPCPRSSEPAEFPVRLESFERVVAGVFEFEI